MSSSRYIPDSQRDAFFKEERGKHGNSKCVDCGTANPQWSSVSFGVLFCLQCSGVHRSLGTHITFVRSVSMDSWKPSEVESVRVGGNSRMISWWKKYGMDARTPIKQKYESVITQTYKEKIKCLVQGKQWEDPSVQDLKQKAASQPASQPARAPYQPSSQAGSSSSSQSRGRRKKPTPQVPNYGAAGRSFEGFGSEPAPAPQENALFSALGEGWSKVSQGAQQLAQITKEKVELAKEKVAQAHIKERATATTQKSWGFIQGLWGGEEAQQQQQAPPQEQQEQQQQRREAGGMGFAATSPAVQEDDGWGAWGEEEPAIADTTPALKPAVDTGDGWGAWGDEEEEEQPPSRKEPETSAGVGTLIDFSDSAPPAESTPKLDEDEWASFLGKKAE